MKDALDTLPCQAAAQRIGSVPQSRHDGAMKQLGRYGEILDCCETIGTSHSCDLVSISVSTYLYMYIYIHTYILMHVVIMLYIGDE